jgi:hypothetical protein
MHVETTARLKDGTSMTARCDGPRGKWGSPPIPDEDHLAKVRECLAVRLDDGQIEEVVALVGRIDELDTGDVKRLMSIVSMPGA